MVANNADNKMTYVKVISCIQLTGVLPISKSRNVSPPTAVTKPIIKYQIDPFFY